MRADLRDVVAVDDNKTVSILEGREAVCDGKCRAPCRESLQSLLDQVLALRVKRRGCLIEDEKLRLVEDGARDRKSLAPRTT